MASPSFGETLLRFGAGFDNPAGAFAAQQRTQQAQQASRQKAEAAKISAFRLALEQMPIEDPRRTEIEARVAQHFGGDQAAANFVTTLRPKAAKPERETLSRGQKIVEFPPGGGPPVEVARGVPFPEDSPFGKAQSGLAMNIVAKARARMRQGAELSDEDRDQLAFAQQILTSPRIIQGPGGELMQAAPLGIPERFMGVFDETPLPDERTTGGVQIEPVSRQVKQNRFELTPLRTGKDTFEKDFQIVLKQTQELHNLLVEGRQEFGGVTGAVGTAKAAFGGAARQVGIPVSAKSKNIKRKIEIIKAIAARHVLGERGRSLSNEDRVRLDKIAGTLDALSDEKDIRDAVRGVVEIMMRMRPNG